MSSKLNKSWENYRISVHSPKGVEELRRDIKWGLMRKYLGIAETMFQWNLDNPKFEDMRVMSRDVIPEKYLCRNGYCVAFEYNGQIHILPAVLNAGINIYGVPNGWSPMPVGYIDGQSRGQNPIADRIRDLKLDATNSVLIRNDIFDGSDYAFIDKMCDLLVDNVMTVNQLQLLAKSPYIFNCSDDQIASAKNLFLELANDKPVIFRNNMGENTDIVEPTSAPIDTTLLDVFRHWENILLEQIGCPGSVQNTKRAQQSVDEINMADDKVSIRRKEKLRMREIACERINDMFGVDISVLSIIDSELDNKESEQPMGKDSKGDDGIDA